MDAGAFGARVDPRGAYRFAKGEEVTSSSGQQVKLSRPLDFLVVSDHSDGMSLFPMIVNGDPIVMADPQGRKWNEMLHAGKDADVALDVISSFSNGTMSKAIQPVPGSPMWLQERAYTSPIWYSPRK